MSILSVLCFTRNDKILVSLEMIKYLDICFYKEINFLQKYFRGVSFLNHTFYIYILKNMQMPETRVKEE